MKKTIIALTILTAVATSAFSQGFVLFQGGLSNGTKVSTNSVDNGAAVGRTAGDSSFYYALFASSSQTTLGGVATAFAGTNGTYAFSDLGTPGSAWELVGIGTNTATVGGVGSFAASTQGNASGNQAAVNGDGGLTVSGIAGGSPGNFVVVGWSANIGSTLANLIAWYNNGSPTSTGWIGQSRIGVGQTLGDNGANATVNVMGTTAAFINGFNLGEITVSVPEPCSMALVALGGASLLALRRKKQ